MDTVNLINPEDCKKYVRRFAETHSLDDADVVK